MATLFAERGTCRFCLSGHLRQVLSFVPTPLGDKYAAEPRSEFAQPLPLDLNLCLDCGNLQTSGVADREVLYTETYAHYLSRPAAVNPTLREQFRAYAAQLAGFFAEHAGLAVEIGSNDGAFCRFLMDNGWRALGIEPAANMVRMARDGGVDTLGDFFSSSLAARVRAERGQAEIVVTNHTMANIDDLDDMLEGVVQLLAPNGVFALQTFYLLDVWQRNLLENFNHEHLDYFYVRSLQALLRRHGLEVFDLERVDAKGGSLRCFIQHSGNRPVSPAVGEAISLEEEAGLHRPDTYASIASFVADGKSKVHALLDGQRALGRQIAAYGTSVGATMFVYQYDLGRLLDFFVDDDPYRQNLKSPGYQLPVYAPSRLLESKPSHVLITAPLYAEQIVRTNQAYVAQGGTFVRIWPEFGVVRP